MTAKEKDNYIADIGKQFSNHLQANMENKSGLSFTQEMDFEEREIIEYQSRMRVFGLEKFNAPCFIAAVNLYLSQRHLEDSAPIGALIVYVAEEHAYRLFKAIGFSDVSEDMDSSLFEACGNFGEQIAGQLKNFLSGHGYSDLALSPPITAKNDIIQGVDFKYSEHKYVQACYYLWKKKTFVIGLTLAPL